MHRTCRTSKTKKRKVGENADMENTNSWHSKPNALKNRGRNSKRRVILKNK